MRIKKKLGNSLCWIVGVEEEWLGRCNGCVQFELDGITSFATKNNSEMKRVVRALSKVIQTLVKCYCEITINFIFRSSDTITYEELFQKL